MRLKAWPRAYCLGHPYPRLPATTYLVATTAQTMWRSFIRWALLIAFIHHQSPHCITGMPLFNCFDYIRKETKLLNTDDQIAEEFGNNRLLCKIHFKHFLQSNRLGTRGSELSFFLFYLIVKHAVLELREDMQNSCDWDFAIRESSRDKARH